MVVTNTTDSIDIVLGATATTNQVHVTASYNQVSSTAVTPKKNVTTTNNLTAVNIVPAPTAGNQHQLRYCNIFNADSAIANVTVRANYNSTTRTVITFPLQVNEYIQYTHRTGWKVFDMNGGLKSTNYNESIIDLQHPDCMLTLNTTTSFSLSTTTYCFYMGKATAAYRNVSLSYSMTTALATPTWAEMAIYKGTPSIGSTVTLTRCGFLDMSTFWLRTGAINFASSIPVTNINAGDDLWLVIGNSAVTSAAFKVNTVGDDIGAGFAQTASAVRPSTNATFTTTAITTATNTMMRFGWSGM